MMRLAVVLTIVVGVASGQRGPTETGLRRELSTLFEHQRYEEAIRLASRAADETRPNADLWIVIAECRFQTDDYAGAAREFEHGLRLDPGLASACVNLGFAYLKLDRLDEAEKVFTPLATNARPDRAAKAELGLGLAADTRGDAAGARTHFGRATKLAPADVRPRYRLAQLDLAAGDAEHALAGFESVLRDSALHHGAAFGVARCHAILGHKAEAEFWATRHARIIEVVDATTRLTRTLASSPDPLRIRLELGALYLSVDARREARQEYIAARAQKPTALGDQLAVARGLADSGEREQALAVYRDVLRLAPGNGEAEAGIAAILAGPNAETRAASRPAASPESR